MKTSAIFYSSLVLLILCFLVHVYIISTLSSANSANFAEHAKSVSKYRRNLINVPEDQQGGCYFISNLSSAISVSFTETSESVSKNSRNKINLSEDQQGDWQSVGHPQYKFWIHSAYSFDDLQVIILGTPPPDDENDQLYCMYYSGKLGIRNKCPATIERMKHWEPKWAGSFVRCPLPPRRNVSLSKPAFVSVVFSDQTASQALLPIRYRPLHGNLAPRNISLCVNPLYQYNQVFHFLEWMEFYKMMGVQQFTFYNISIGPATSCVMNHLMDMDDGINIKVNPWHHYPQKSDSDIYHGEGLSAAANACLYSHKGLSKYMIFVDVDELIVPRNGIPDFPHLLKRVESRYPQDADKAGAYVFRNGFFGQGRAEDPELGNRCAPLVNSEIEFTVCQKLWTMRLVERDPFQPWGQRTKSIVLPERVKNMGPHYVQEYEPGNGWQTIGISEQVVFSRHYRQIGENGETTKDRIPQAVGLRLAKNTARTLEYVVKGCNLSIAEVFQ